MRVSGFPLHDLLIVDIFFPSRLFHSEQTWRSLMTVPRYCPGDETVVLLRETAMMLQPEGRSENTWLFMEDDYVKKLLRCIISRVARWFAIENLPDKT